MCLKSHIEKDGRTDKEIYYKIGKHIMFNLLKNIFLGKKEIAKKLKQWWLRK